MAKIESTKAKPAPAKKSAKAAPAAAPKKKAKKPKGPMLNTYEIIMAIKTEAPISVVKRAALWDLLFNCKDVTYESDVKSVNVTLIDQEELDIEEDTLD